MDKNPTEHEIEGNLSINHEFDSNQNGFDSNQNGFDSNQNRFDSNQNGFDSNYTPNFPLTRLAAAKLLGKSDAAIVKWINKLFTVYSEVEKSKLFDRNKITEWGFEQLVAFQRATSPEIPSFDRTTGEIFWDVEGQPMAMIENENKIPSKNYLKNLQDELMMADAEIMAVEVDTDVSALVPVDIDEIAIAEAISLDKMEAQSLLAEAADNYEQSELLYQKVRAIQRRKAAARGALAAAEDAQIESRAYRAAQSQIQKQKLEAENNDK